MQYPGNMPSGKQERSDTIRKCMQAMVVLCVTAAITVSCASAADTADLRVQIDAVGLKRSQAHQMAELVRGFGEEDSHPAIQFAKEKWEEQQEALTNLLSQHRAAQEREGILYAAGRMGGPSSLIM